MGILLSDLNLLTWQWHDADLLSIRLEYMADGDLSFCLRTKISEYEDQQQLQKLGIHTLLVEVHFDRVERVGLASLAQCSGQELILDWDFVASNPKHHKIKCSCGTTIELQFDSVWLQDHAQ